MFCANESEGSKLLRLFYIFPIIASAMQPLGDARQDEFGKNKAKQENCRLFWAGRNLLIFTIILQLRTSRRHRTTCISVKKKSIKETGQSSDEFRFLFLPQSLIQSFYSAQMNLSYKVHRPLNMQNSMSFHSCFTFLSMVFA